MCTQGYLRKAGVVLLSVSLAIPLVVFAQTNCIERSLLLPHNILAENKGTICVPLGGTGTQVSFWEGKEKIDAELVKSGYIRDQRIGIFRLSLPESSVALELKFKIHTDSPLTIDTGPLTGLCRRVIQGYDVPLKIEPPQGPGTFSRCENLRDCRDAMADLLLICGHSVYQSPYVDSLAMIWTDCMGLNVAAIDVANISVYSPVEIRDFIKSLYDYACAEHFGDGHLGFVVLLGDAYEDDNQTPMIPSYNGYGGDAEASDHFYACVSGEDDFEDLIIGRVPVGNEQELATYYRKRLTYTPLSPLAWTSKILFIAGCNFASKDDYIALFDSLAEYVPSDYTVSRFYRYDLPESEYGDSLACQAISDSLNQGVLFAFYVGDGDKWDWGGRFQRVFRSSLIDDLSNSDRLPIIFSISCSNGWFDNIEQQYSDGKYDCFAERMVLSGDGGAIACFASCRETGAGIVTTLLPQIIKSAFVNQSALIGELLVEAKLKHLAHLGNVLYVRQFNLLGDPCLDYVRSELPTSKPDLAVKPYHVTVEPEFPSVGESFFVKPRVWNMSAIGVDEFTVTLFDGSPDSGGTAIGSVTMTEFWPWEYRDAEIAVETSEPGDVNLYVVVDPADQIEEIDESNNTVSLRSYVYPCEKGFPVKVADNMKMHLVSDFDGDGNPDILVTSGGSCAEAIRFDGTTMWHREDLGMPDYFDGVYPSCFDLNNDGRVEIILTAKSLIYALDSRTGVTIWKRYTDYASVSPAVCDIGADGNFEVLLGTYSPMSRQSKVYAFDCDGSYRWIQDVLPSGERIVALVICDIEIDGNPDIIAGGDKGSIMCLKCDTDPPGEVWSSSLPEGNLSALVACDIQRDGTLEVVAGTETAVYVLNATDGTITGSVALDSPATDVSIGDVDNDGLLEIVCTSSDARLHIVDGGEVTLSTQIGGTPCGPAAIVDVDGDGNTEIITTLEEGILKILRIDGSDYLSPVPVRGMCFSAPTAFDLDGDGKVEVVTGSLDSLLFVLDMGAPGGREEWSCAGGSPTRDGLYAQPFYGTLTQDSRIHGRVDIVADVMVEAGATLIVERGTQVRFNPSDIFSGGSSADLCEFVVKGRLISSGSSTSQIAFYSIAWPPATDAWLGILADQGSDVVISHTTIANAVSGVECHTSQLYLSESTIKDCILGVKIVSCSPQIDHCTITSNTYGISADGGGPILTGNQVYSNIFSGIILSDSCEAVLEGNRVRYTTDGNGLACYSSSPLILHGNRFEYNSASGIYLSNSCPSIDSCWIGYNGDCGIKATYYSQPVIRKTSIVANTKGVSAYSYASPILGDLENGIGGENDIRQNTSYAVYNITPNEIKAQGNWWGTDSPDPSLFRGPVDYSNWLLTSPAGVEPRVEDRLAIRLAPNPFHTNIRIELEVPSPNSPVQVLIFDIKGRLVRKLVSTSSQGRLLTCTWDGVDGSGCYVASGVYLLVVDTPDARITRKVIFLR